MSTRLYTTQLTVPAGTAINAPVSQSVQLEDNELDSVQIIIPDGHNGLTGVAILSGGSPVAPFGLATWITGNDEKPVFPYGAEITADGFTVTAYNTDIYPHTFYFRWLVSDLNVTAPVAIASPQAGQLPAPGDVLAVADLSGVAS